MQVHSIAEAAQGDLFNAIETLQLVGAGKSDPALLRAARTKKAHCNPPFFELLWHLKNSN